MNYLKIVIAFFFLGLATDMFAANGKDSVVQIKTSAICDQCKDRIETALVYEKGIKKAELDLKTKVLTVTYKPEKIDITSIRKLIAATGYDADEVKADPRAFSKLPACCQKE